ncbi:uncharacterized protein LOC116770331 isoform X2 [Danaus plexippus]|nr:uncharacterized protein LOC116770331 isoform X2 [Danaus plexippus]XP_032517655.1 uncharacterized protein LOC116770331 isoform X2 [Danaus plexippus]
MVCMVFTAGLLIMTVSAISAGIFIGYTYCYMEHRTGFRPANTPQAKELPIINLPKPSPEEVHKRTINGALASSLLVEKILRIIHSILDDEHVILPYTNEKTLFNDV